jgi:hypothetical protein
VIPAVVVVPHRDIEPAYGTAIAGDVHIQYVGIAGEGRQADTNLPEVPIP